MKKQVAIQHSVFESKHEFYGKSKSEARTLYIVLGLGLSGRSAVRFLLANEKNVVAIDDSLIMDDELTSYQARGVQFLSKIDTKLLAEAVCLVKSPGIPETHPVVSKAISLEVPVIGDVELVVRSLVNKPCVGVTGTNGKTTTSLLIGHLLQSVGKNFKVCGNVGVPITDVVLEDEFDGVVIELSSYQLETLHSPFLDVAVILNITPDHLDRYPSFEEYQSAKLKIFSLLKDGGEGVAHKELESVVNDHVILYGGGLTLPKHDTEHFKGYELDNIEAAFHVCRHFGFIDDQLSDALFTFKKPPHRIEFVGRASGVSYYNDSKGTNIDAVEKAVSAMDGSVILIAGGVDKGTSYLSWIKCFSNKVKKICAIGEAAPKIKMQLGEKLPIEIFDGLHQAVLDAVNVSEPGDNILLSPGCASFDMFRNYQHRGDEFKRIVHLITIGENGT